MNVQQQFAAEGLEVTRVDYDDAVVLTADLGPGTDVTVDVVGETVIVVAGDDQYEVEVAADLEPEVRTNNGVLTVEVER
jgi:HSP20 family molecular chaperone IbpA